MPKVKTKATKLKTTRTTATNIKIKPIDKNKKGPKYTFSDHF